MTITTTPAATAARVLPLPQSNAEGARFTFGLIHDVAAVLEAHGYPRLTGRDMTELMAALFSVLYGSPTPEGPAA